MNNLLNKKRPLILTFAEVKKIEEVNEKPYVYCYFDNINKSKMLSSIPFVNIKNSNQEKIINLETMTESFSDPNDDEYFHLNLETMTKAYSDPGDEIMELL